MGKREWTGLVVAAMLAACGGDAGDESGTPADTGAMAPGAGGPTATTPAPPTGATGTQPGATDTTRPGGGALPPGVTRDMVASGKTVFESAGPCYTCHGADASGTALAPNLRDSQWLNTDGSLEGIEGIVRNGVPTPKQFPAPMPAMGGAQLSNDQVRAVAAYVYSISHGG